MNHPLTLQNKTILITGASSGIGKQTAISITENGGKVIITGRNQSRLKETFSALKDKGHIQVLAELTNEKERNELVKKLPEIDGLVHSAGITAHMPCRFIRQKDIDKSFHINYDATVLLTAGILGKKKMKRGGSFVFISTISTHYQFVGGALYIGSNAAIEAYSRVLSIEMAPKKIRSNSISPSLVSSPLVKDAAKVVSQEVMEKVEKMMPLGLGKPQDVANTIMFLLSDAGNWITGENIILGGVMY